MADSPDSSALTPAIRQEIKGDRNPVFGAVSGGNVFGNAENVTLNQITQQLPRSPEIARYSLPLDAADFTGRDAEIEQIEADIKAGRVVAIAGMPGVGKSALAVRVAHRLKPQFPDGQIYLNLRGTDSQPLTVEAALENLLRALGVDPTQIPVEMADRVAQYRSKMAQTQTLVLLDNAADAHQVEDLLPGAGACLITSRRQLDGLVGVTRLNLEALPADQALALFEKVLSPQRVQAELETARQIVVYCGRLPLALRIAAATLGSRSWQGKPLANYAQQLVDQRQRLDHLKLDNLDIRASFELSYRELGPSAAHLLGWLGLLPTDFGTAILEPLTQEPADSLQQALAALVDGRLVDPHNPETGERYILHDLMRLFALEKLETEVSPKARQAATVRLVQWCEEQSNKWVNVIDPVSRRQWAEALAVERASADPGKAPITAANLEPRLLQMALSWFEAERQTLVHAFDWASATQQWQASVALAANLASFFQLRGYWGDWVHTHQQALTAARQASDPRGEGKTLNNLGGVYQSQGKWSEAIAHYDQASQIFRSLGDVHNKARTLGNLGNVYKSQGKWGEAIASYEQSLPIYRSLGDVHGEAQTLNNLGNVYKSQGKWGEAIASYKQSLQIKLAIGDVHGGGITLTGLGNVYESQGKWGEAIAHHEQSLQIKRALGDLHGEGTTIMNLGNVYYSQGKWGEAINAYEQSLQIFRSLGDVHGEGQTLHNLGNVYKSQGKWSEAIAAYEQSLQIYRALGDVHGEGQTLANLGFLHQKRGRLIQAAEYLQEASTKLHPDSPEYRQVYALLHPGRGDLATRVCVLLLGVVALVFVVSNLLAGRWLVALAIIGIAVVAFRLLKTLQRRRQT